MYNIDYSIAHARACGIYFYKIKFLRLKENSYNLQKFCTLKITRCMVHIVKSQILIIIVGAGACIPTGKKHALISDGYL